MVPGQAQQDKHADTDGELTQGSPSIREPQAIKEGYTHTVGLANTNWSALKSCVYILTLNGVNLLYLYVYAYVNVCMSVGVFLCV